MTENNIPTCERCGTPMIEYYMRSRSGWASQHPSWVCPLDPEDCELKALRSEVEALRKRNEELERLFSESQAYAREKLNALCAAESRAQEAETKLRAAEQEADELAKDFIQEQRVTFELSEKLRAAEDAVVVLREALEHAVKQNDCDMLLTGDELREMAQALSNTSALAAQRKREIVREALEQAAAKLSKNPYRVQEYSFVMGTGWVTLTKESILAAIFNTTEPA